MCQVSLGFRHEVVFFSTLLWPHQNNNCIMTNTVKAVENESSSIYCCENFKLIIFKIPEPPRQDFLKQILLSLFYKKQLMKLVSITRKRVFSSLP